MKTTNLGASPERFQPLKPGPGRSRIEVATDQRGRIERAMVTLVGREGYEGITVRKLTSTAHVSTGTFYALFSGTDQCFWQVHKALIDRIRERIADTRSLHLDRRQQATLALRAMIQALTNDRASARFIVMEVFVGGPAALGPASEGEACLALGLKESLDRRGERVPTPVVTWITAGIINWVRSLLDAETRSPEGEPMDEMIEWGVRIATNRPSPDLEPRREPAACRTVTSPRESGKNIGGDDAELLVAAAKRLALAEGYRRLSMASICRAAGLTTTAFRRHFNSVEAIYLEVVRRLAASLFDVAIGERNRDRSASGPDVDDVCRRIAADPVTARIALLGVIEPGREGLDCTRGLITDVATACEPGRRAVDPTTEAAVAALWAVFARELRLGEGHRLPATARTLDRLFALAMPEPTRRAEQS